MMPRSNGEAFGTNKHATGGKGAVRPRVLTRPLTEPPRGTESQNPRVVNKSG